MQLPQDFARLAWHLYMQLHQNSQKICIKTISLETFSCSFMQEGLVTQHIWRLNNWLQQVTDSNGTHWTFMGNGDAGGLTKGENIYIYDYRVNSSSSSSGGDCAVTTPSY